MKDSRNRTLRLAVALAGLNCLLAAPAHAQRIMENLGRGVVAVRSGSGQVFVSWRLLGLEPSNLGFDVFRSAGGGPEVKLNSSPLTGGTNFVDVSANLGQSNVYTIRPVGAGAAGSFTLPANAPVRQYLPVPLRSAPGSPYVHLAWVGDLDGNGEYDLVADRIPTVANTTVKVDAYRRDGTFLWRVDMGPNSLDMSNIGGGSAALSNGHNDGVTVYDLDSDGRAEVILKTANGTILGNGATVAAGANVTQFISVLDGRTGAERARAQIPNDYRSAGPYSGHFGILYADGVNPSIVFKAKNRNADGSFNSATNVWDFRNGTLLHRWKWLRGSQDAPDAHQIRVVDVDRDGRDELVDGGYVIDDNGTLLWSQGPSGVIHGDRFHIGDFDPARAGLEGFFIQQNNPSGLLYITYDARTGAILRRHTGGVEDTARGNVADIDPRHPGFEYWSFHGIHSWTTGAVISPEPQRPWPNFRIWWDGDNLSELLNRTFVEKWNPTSATVSRILNAGAEGAIHSWRDAPMFYGDIIGDWREEVVFENAEHTELRIYTTTMPSGIRLYTLPHNPEYRAALTVKGYMQSHQIDYFLGNGMGAPPAPNIRYAGTPSGGATHPAESAVMAGGAVFENTRSGFNGSGYCNFPPSGGTLEFRNVDGGTGGSRTIRLRNAQGGGTPRTGRLTVNGVSQDITFAPTGGWTSWAVTSVTVTLAPGTANTIELESIGQDLANIDELQVP
jgi:rhamnogalacturonan endolyase